MTAYTGAAQKFLTLFTSPVLFDGEYYDLWFLRATPQTFTQVRRRLYSGATLLSTVFDTLPTSSEGVYRHQIQRSSTEDSIIVDLWSGSAVSESLTIAVNTDAAIRICTLHGRTTWEEWTIGNSPHKKNTVSMLNQVPNPKGTYSQVGPRVTMRTLSDLILKGFHVKQF